MGKGRMYFVTRSLLRRRARVRTALGWRAFGERPVSASQPEPRSCEPRTGRWSSTRAGPGPFPTATRAVNQVLDMLRGPSSFARALTLRDQTL